MSETISIGVRGFGSYASPRGGALPEDLNGDGKRFRKIGRFIKLALAGAERAVASSGMTVPRDRTGVFMGTGLGNLPELTGFADSVFSEGEIFPSPIQFANSVGNAGAFYIAQAFEIVGPVLAVSQDELSFECALLNAEGMLRTRAIDYALVGGVDVFWPPVEDQRLRMGYPAGSEVEAGEGSGWLLLERASESSCAVLERAWAGDRERALQTVREGAERGALLSLNTRLVRQGDLPEDLRRLGRFDAGCSAFLTESAVAASEFLSRARAGETLCSLTETRDGQLGAYVLRKGAAG